MIKMIYAGGDTLQHALHDFNKQFEIVQNNVVSLGPLKVETIKEYGDERYYVIQQVTIEDKENGS